MTGDRFELLIVCHANLCRSPMAERLTRRRLSDRLGPAAAAFDVVSAGTHAWSNRAMHPLAAEVLREYDVDDDEFRSRRLTAGMVSRADLILTATAQQRAACVAFCPAAVRRTFTIAQFGRYAAALPRYGLVAFWPPQQRFRQMIDEVEVVRGTLPVGSPEDDDLTDPVGLPITVFRRCAAEIHEVVDMMTELIAPVRSAPQEPRPDQQPVPDRRTP
jgi:protein-tyrosine phosphatase